MENMENEAKKPEVKEKKAGGKKKGNKPAANPQGRSRAKSTVLANFQKNTLANNSSLADAKKPIVTGMNQDKFKNLLGMFDKKPEDPNKEKEKPSFGKMNSDRMAMFNKNSNDDSKVTCPGEVQNKPRLSIKERMAALMQSKEDMKPKKKIDPILEKLHENNDDEEDEDSGDDDLSDEDNLDISEGEDKDNDDLGKSESLSEEKSEGKKDEKKVEDKAEVDVLAEVVVENIPENKKEDVDGKVVEVEVKKNEENEENQENENKKKEDLNKSEELDD